MFTKKRNLLILLLIVILASSVVFAGCFHEHSYTGAWKVNETQHWKECKCGRRNYVHDHTIDNFVTDKEATETETGSKHGYCSGCEQDITVTIPVLTHKHDFSGSYSFDNDNHWKECSCGEKRDTNSHTVNDWVIQTEPTETDKGLKSGVCEICKNTVTKEIPATGQQHTHTYGSWSSDASEHWKECACGYEDPSSRATHTKQWIVDTPATTTSTGLKHEECVVCHKQFGSEVIDKLTTTTRTVDFYAINDFHGAVDNIPSVGGYLKERKNTNPNTILINSGDMFQGSIESNSNRGKLLTDCMSVIGFDSFTYGNHEFDWGLDNLEQLAANAGTTKFLGANIYHWNSQTGWGSFANELAEKYVVKTLENGLKVGIIGVIGRSQITSISSNLVQTIGFKDPLPIIKELSATLRQTEGCDVVVVSAHVGPQGLVGEKDDNGAPTTAAGLENYVDAVFCAHSHQVQNYVVDGLPFIQGGSKGSHVSYIQLEVDSEGNVTCKIHDNIQRSSSWANLVIPDITDLIDNSNEQIKDERNQYLTYLDANLNSSNEVPRLACRAIAEFATSQGYDISLALVNNARKNIYKGDLYYPALYEALPFDNVIYIAKVLGSDLLKEVEYMSYGSYGNSIWRVNGEAIESNKYYYIAVIDYLLYHQNTDRVYNYFPSAFTSGFEPIALTNNGNDYNYREITRDYLLNNKINTSDYKENNTNIDNSQIRQTVSLDITGSGSGGSGSGGDEPSTVIHTGTLADPYSVSDAIILAGTATSSADCPKGYVKGIVSDITSIVRGSASDDIGKIYIRDESTGDSIYIYYITKFEGATKGNNWAWNENGKLVEGELQVGDEIVLYAKSLYSYNGNPQIGSGYCITINGISTN